MWLRYIRAAAAGLSAWAVAALLAASGAAAQTNPPVDAIHYVERIGGLCRLCYSLTIRATAVGSLEIETVTRPRGADAGETRREIRRITPEQFAALREQLAPIRATVTGVFTPRDCDTYLTDADTVQVTWLGDGGNDVLNIYSGCTLNRRPGLVRDLLRVPDILGVDRPTRYDRPIAPMK